MSEIHYIKNARNEKSTFDLSWTIYLCIQFKELLYKYKILLSPHKLQEVLLLDKFYVHSNSHKRNL